MRTRARHQSRRGRGTSPPPARVPAPRPSRRAVRPGALVVRVRRPALHQLMLAALALLMTGLAWVGGPFVAVLAAVCVPLALLTLIERIDVTTTAVVVHTWLGRESIPLDEIVRLRPAPIGRPPRGFSVRCRDGAWHSLPSVRCTAFTGQRRTAEYLENVIRRVSADPRARALPRQARRGR